ncbi:MAG: hypothetical protein UR85_C0004G0083 [Candidatus Nomurabacteria bacterium GW2011_GWF2_35_66]|uniref:Glucosamine/galactosamine-6-phosphate isomerase domain-containing protein n=1 Tax=Candidatus Nomurabacteria bacterium GW2011_GWE1_35_16 TaxID=1618761 RepID=A0A0G0BBJ9_9BACT|nr:MAG: hypothetical protein UR55_C0002G0082 [Candidatus Nomurabacteria bacterium GW2011_GWF1_34_20]KKP63661.1 MAG: hypothetical protein UR57_C0002G0082 [Candidatus Nomurabacteria bacterium GW2011_GWE2_34_25]KKP66863.1 MAG: hypothetical protein UR64_C0002G0079 [Candidatus Nomurabacteria bacterium GW2011_GWE1_35_16]KKP83489.1 MAG: hypothetical protein UR85_C0004G0083 [Candidatus Nomurabacteria bacterium GW2011_GWF2_35_66]HAE36579.1 hypothetical protein [Candidatus Nomurabacteria bacterium]
MNLNIKTTKDMKEVADFVASSINKKLEEGKKVLWFVSGGSAIPMEVLVAKKIKEKLSDNLVVALVDERYGPVGHPDSNWFKLEIAGFKIKGAKMIPILINKNMKETIEKTKDIMTHELNKAKYKIGIFGIGIDGHTAGILPHTIALKSNDIICTYDTDLHSRITITPKTIEKLDEAILYAMGESKWASIELLKKDISIEDEPAQILKKVPLLTIFTDYKKI